MVRQAGFVDLEKRLVGDMPKCDCLERITVLLDFVLLRPELERAVCPPPCRVQPCNCSPRRAQQRLRSCAVAGREEGGRCLDAAARLLAEQAQLEKCADSGMPFPTSIEAGGQFPALATPAHS
jgi:hypothetical protein